jgi:hypothetical protein
LVRGPQQVTALPLNVIHDTTPSRLRCRLIEMNPG